MLVEEELAEVAEAMIVEVKSEERKDRDRHFITFIIFSLVLLPTGLCGILHYTCNRLQCCYIPCYTSICPDLS